jgi:hypothetical protein
LHRIRKDAVFRDGAISRPNSGAFKPKRGESPSVHVESMLIGQGLTFRNALDDHEDDFLLVALWARDVRALGLGVILDPDLADGPRGLAHALITGRISGRIRDELAARCEKVIWE